MFGKDSLIQGSANYSLRANSRPQLFLQTEFYWDTLLLEPTYGCFHTTVAEKSTCHRDPMACKASGVYSLALY